FACARRTPPRLSFPTRRSSDLTLVSVIPDDGFHKQQIDHAAELIFAAEVNLNRYRIGFQTIFKLLYDFKEISTGTVHLVDEYHRSEEHTSELQSRENLVCRLLL